MLIVGGGDSALDWTLNLAPLAKHLTLLHRRNDFRAAPDSVNKMRALVGKAKSICARPGHLAGRSGRPAQYGRRQEQRRLNFEIALRRNAAVLRADMKLGPVANWGSS